MNKVRVVLLIILICSSILIWYAVLESSNDALTVAFLDVGQGDAIFIESPTGTQMLIDGGPGQAVLRELSNVMPFYDRSLDVVLATHADQDHIGGLPEVLDRFNVALIVETGNASETGIYDAFEQRREAEHADRIVARRGQILDLGGGAYVKILFPDRDVASLETNTSSIVAQLIFGEQEFLLTGDSPASIEEYLVFLDKEGLRSDVLKLGHHGSRTSSSEIFVGFVSPEYAIVSAGKDNRYGHPHSEVLAILEGLEIETFATYEKGTIVFESNGETITVK